MNININEMAKLIIEKIKNMDGYIEMKEGDLQNSISKYLAAIYQGEMEYAVMKIEHDRLKNIKINKNDYIYEYKLVEDKLIKAAEALAVSTKEELQHLI